MTKQKRILVVAGMSLLAVSAVAATASSAFLTKSVSGDQTWYHYDAVAPTTKTVGSKEYWTDCNGNTVLTAPSGTIEEKGAPSQAFINNLELTDERRVGQLGAIDFEDASDLDLLSIDAKSAEIIEDATATSGTHSLKLVARGSTDGSCVAYVQINKDTLDQLFADPNVKGIWFDAKASGNFNNFRRWTSSVGAITYDRDFKNGPDKLGNNWCTGLDTNWKKFCFERSFYEEAKAFTGTYRFISCESLSLGAEIYIDNIRIESYGRESWSNFGFETGTLRCNNVAGTEWYSYGYVNNDSRHVTASNDNVCDFRIVGNCGAETVSWDYNIKSQGNRSLKITKQLSTSGTELRLELPSEFVNANMGEGYLIDVMFDEKIDGEDVNACTGAINPSQVARNIIVDGVARAMYNNKWSTLFIPKANFTATTDNFVRVLRWNGSQCNGTFWIDNLRPAFGTFGFEDISYGNSTTNAEVGLLNAPASERKGGENLRDFNDHIFYINGNGVVSAESSTDYYTEGTHSMKYVHSSSDKTFCVYMNKYIVSNMADDQELLIDVMTKDGKIENFCGNQTVLPDGQWHTYSISKATMNSLRSGGNHYCLAYGTSRAYGGTYYFDNIRFVTAA